MIDRLKAALPMLFRRLSEPSSYAGMSGIATLWGISAPAFAAYCGAAAVIFGLAAIVMPERLAETVAATVEKISE